MSGRFLLTEADRRGKALPFPGTAYNNAFLRNDFTYGVAMFQHGYLAQSAEFFEQAVATRPNDPEAYYNLGTLSLRRGDREKARVYLEQTLKLRPQLSRSVEQSWHDGCAARQFRRADSRLSRIA